MPHRKIANWTTIRKMCQRRFTGQTAEEVVVRAVELDRPRAEVRVAIFEHKGEVAQEAVEVVMEEAAAVATDVVVGKMHTAAARKVVEAVAMEVMMVALRVIHNDTARVSLEAVAKEASKVTMHELREGIVARETEAEAQMYIDNTAAEESRVATATVVVAGRTSAWLLIDGDEMEVEKDNEDEAALAAMEEEHVAPVEAKRITA
jgi:hypothetical protein